MEYMLSLLIPVLIACSSCGVDNYYDSTTGAAGCLLITADRLEYINALPHAHAQAIGKQAYIYTLDDRFDHIKAQEIAYKYLYHMGNAYRRDNGGKMPDMEVLARIWKGGEM